MNLYTRILSEYEFGKPIAPQLLKYSNEYYALAVLRYLFPGKYDDLEKSEAPDFQNGSHSLGIEVIQAVSKEEMTASAEYANIRYKKQREYSKNSNMIDNRRGEPLDFPAFGSERMIFDMYTALEKKSSKVSQYRATVECLCIAMIIDLPLTDNNRNTVFEFLNSNQFINEYDYVFAFFWNSFVGLNRIDHSVTVWEIESDVRRRLLTIARMTAERIIDLSSSEWN